MVSALQKELIEKITATADEALLQLIKQEIDYFTDEANTSNWDGLSIEDRG